MKKVAVIMGSDSDWAVVQKAVATLGEYGVPCETHVMSAHRTPADAAAFADFVAGKVPMGSNSRGSAAYRTHLCRVLTRRCALELGGEAQ